MIKDLCIDIKHQQRIIFRHHSKTLQELALEYIFHFNVLRNLRITVEAIYAFRISKDIRLYL
jgi:hypothetical protein